MNQELSSLVPVLMFCWSHGETDQGGLQLCDGPHGEHRAGLGQGQHPLAAAAVISCITVRQQCFHPVYQPWPAVTDQLEENLTWAISSRCLTYLLSHYYYGHTTRARAMSRLFLISLLSSFIQVEHCNFIYISFSLNILTSSFVADFSNSF